MKGKESLAGKILEKQQTKVSENADVQFYPFMQVLSQILSKNGEFFNFSERTKVILYEYLEKSQFYDFLVKKASGLNVVIDKFGLPSSTLTRSIMDKILNSKVILEVEINSVLEEKRNNILNHCIENYITNDRDYFGKKYTQLKTDTGTVKLVIPNLHIPEFEKIFNHK